jgi:hypothetical protein
MTTLDQATATTSTGPPGDLTHPVVRRLPCWLVSTTWRRSSWPYQPVPELVFLAADRSMIAAQEADETGLDLPM